MLDPAIAHVLTPAPVPDSAQWECLITATERLAAARSIKAVVDVLRDTARAIVGSEGIAVVLREGDECFYAAEDSMSPLWAGQRFPARSCVSGWAMMEHQTVDIRDVYVDARVPQEAYRATFVRSMVMVPIGSPEAVAALGAYWSESHDHDPQAIRRFEALARSAAIALENIRLLTAVQDSDRQRLMALTAGRMGVWTLHMPSMKLDTSSTCRMNFGRDPRADFSYDDLHAAIHPDDRARVARAIEQSIQSRADYDVEYRLITPWGEVRWIGIRAQPAYDGDGRPISLSGVSIDITERKTLEERLLDMAVTLERRVEERTGELMRTQEALRQSQKLEAMGQLTGGVAHDFNNLLTPIMGSLDLLHRRGIGGDRERRLITNALESAERAKTLVQRLLAFARSQPLSPASVDIAALLIEMSSLIGTTLGPRVELLIDIADDLPAAHADQNQVEMALLNLAVNARDAMQGGGCLTVSARHDVADKSHRAGLKPGAYILISVTDNGTGMDEVTRQRAIEPFFSTKGIGKGTGLGLSMVHGLVSQLGGALAITSSPGRGTTIEMWLPTSGRKANAECAAATAEPCVLKGTVLLVDDEEAVRASATDMLVELGFKVIEARNAAEALEQIDAGQRFDLLITDHLMPAMSGLELARLVRARFQSVAILIVSGYAEAIGSSVEFPTLNKPFRQSDLALGVTAVLSRPGHAAVTAA